MAMLSMVLLLLGVVALPALAQGYPPPPPPPSGGGTATVEITTCPNSFTAEGRGWLADSTVVIEVFAAGGSAAMAPLATNGLVLAQQGNRVAAFTAAVDSDGEFTAHYQFEPDYDRNSARIRISGRDANNKSTTFTRTVRLVDRGGCDRAIGVAGEAEVDPAVGGQGSDGGPGTTDASQFLAFTGRNLLILLAIALLLVTFGTILVRSRRQATSTA